MKHVRVILIALLSGAAAGFVIGGFGGRIVMRMVVDSIGRVPELTIATLNVLLVGTIFGIVGGLFFLVVKKFLPRSPLLQGIALTGVVFAITSVPFFLRPPSPDSELVLNPSLGRLLFSILFVAYGIAVPFVARFLDGFMPTEERHRTPIAIATLVLGAPGVLGLGLILSFLIEA
jgi:hypothetical protein